MNQGTVRFAWLVGVLAMAACGGSPNASASANPADGPAQPPASAGGPPKTAVLHATVTVTGGLQATGSFDDRLQVATCADVAAHGTAKDGVGSPLFYVPEPPEVSGEAGSIGGGHTFSSDVSATYKGPGRYTANQLNATQMRVDAPPGSQETHIFAHPDNIGTFVANPDGSGSFEFHGWQDPGSVLISGQVTWTCGEVPLPS